MKSHYLVYTNENANQIYNRLKPYLDDNDYIFISEVTSNMGGWLNTIACDWINKHP